MMITSRQAKHTTYLTPKVLPKNSEKQPLPNARQVAQLWNLFEDMQPWDPQPNLVVYMYTRFHARILHHLWDHNDQSSETSFFQPFLKLKFHLFLIFKKYAFIFLIACLHFMLRD